MKTKPLIITGALVVVVAIGAAVLYAYWDQAVPLAAMAINFVRTLSAPSGTTTTEEAALSNDVPAVVSLQPLAATLPTTSADDWPSYNRTLTSRRYSPLSQINTQNVGQLKVLCTYDTKQYTSFEVGPIMVNGALIGTTEHDIFSLAKTGAYRHDFKLVPKDWHDWDASTAPSVIQTKGGKKLLAVAPKDGHLYGFDLGTNAMLYRVPATRIENVDAPFVVGKAVHFCPGTVGGAEWNGPAYDPQTNLILIGEVDWCATVTLETDAQIRKVPLGQPSSGMATHSPYHTYGTPDSFGHWAGWVYADDADTGVWKWRLKSNYPILSGMTPTAGGIVFFGDMGGNFYVLNVAAGRRLWGQKIGGAIGGGVITYTANGAQKVAVAVGFTSILWPTEVVTGKIVIMGLDEASASPRQASSFTPKRS
jgi:glucose dehydrogenase